jgi:hypothetical protein
VNIKVLELLMGVRRKLDAGNRWEDRRTAVVHAEEIVRAVEAAGIPTVDVVMDALRADIQAIRKQEREDAQLVAARWKSRVREELRSCGEAKEPSEAEATQPSLGAYYLKTIAAAKAGWRKGYPQGDPDERDPAAAAAKRGTLRAP